MQHAHRRAPRDDSSTQICLSVRKMNRLKYERSFAEAGPLPTASSHEKLLQHAHCVQRGREGGTPHEKADHSDHRDSDHDRNVRDRAGRVGQVRKTVVKARLSGPTKSHRWRPRRPARPSSSRVATRSTSSSRSTTRTTPRGSALTRAAPAESASVPLVEHTEALPRDVRQGCVVVR